MSFSKVRTAAAFLSLAALAGCSDAPKLSQDVPVLVNGAPITRVEVDRAAKALVAQNKIAQPVAAELMKQVTEQAVNHLVTAELLYQAAKKVEVKDLDRQVAEKMAQSKTRFRSQAEFEQALKSVNMTQKEAEQALRKDLVIAAMVGREFAPKAVVSDAEVRKFYEDNKEKAFRQGERVRVSQILVAVAQQASPQAKQQALEKAQALLKRVKGGENFAKVAGAESAPPTNKNGGDLGIIGRGDTAPAFEKAAFALKPGEVSGVVESPLGFHIVKLAGKLPPSVSGFAEVKGQIEGFLKQAKVRQALAEFAAQLRAKAKIEKV